MVRRGCVGTIKVTAHQGSTYRPIEMPDLYHTSFYDDPFSELLPGYELLNARLELAAIGSHAINAINELHYVRIAFDKKYLVGPSLLRFLTVNTVYFGDRRTYSPQVTYRFGD